MELQKLVIKAHQLEMEKKLVKKGYSEEEAHKYLEMCEKEPIPELLREILEEKKLSTDEIEKYFDVINNPHNISISVVENLIRNNVPQHQKSIVEMIVTTTPMLIVALGETKEKLGVEIRRISFAVTKMVSDSRDYSVTELFKIKYHGNGYFEIFVDHELYQSSIERYEIMQKNM